MEMQIFHALSCDSLKSHTMADQPTQPRCPINYSKCATAMPHSTLTQKHPTPGLWHKAWRRSGKQKLHPQFYKFGWGMRIPPASFFLENLGLLFIKTRMRALRGNVLTIRNVMMNPNFCRSSSLFLSISLLWYTHFHSGKTTSAHLPSRTVLF